MKYLQTLRKRINVFLQDWKHYGFLVALKLRGDSNAVRLAEHYEIPSSPVWAEPERIVPTKAYADQRQKMPHNRRRKPKKAMRNLYQLR